MLTVSSSLLWHLCHDSLLFRVIGCTFVCQRLAVAGVTLKRELIMIAAYYLTYTCICVKDLVCPKQL
jgi:hypothetical protein